MPHSHGPLKKKPLGSCKHYSKSMSLRRTEALCFMPHNLHGPAPRSLRHGPIALLGLRYSAQEPKLPSGFYLKPSGEPYTHSVPDLAEELVTQLPDVAKPTLPSMLQPLHRTRITPISRSVAAWRRWRPSSPSKLRGWRARSWTPPASDLLDYPTTQCQAQ